MARFFIDRPIFAWVIAIVIMLAGLLAIDTLPIAQYPEIAPPSVRVTTSYRGAAASTVESNVVQVIEENMTGLDNFLYMKSESTSSGRVSMTLTFESGTDPDMAQVQVQNKLQGALSSLPQAVQQEGVSVAKAKAQFSLMRICNFTFTGKLSVKNFFRERFIAIKTLIVTLFTFLFSFLILMYGEM